MRIYCISERVVDKKDFRCLGIYLVSCIFCEIACVGGCSVNLPSVGKFSSSKISCSSIEIWLSSLYCMCFSDGIVICGEVSFVGVCEEDTMFGVSVFSLNIAVTCVTLSSRDEIDHPRTFAVSMCTVGLSTFALAVMFFVGRLSSLSHAVICSADKSNPETIAFFSDIPVFSCNQLCILSNVFI